MTTDYYSIIYNRSFDAHMCGRSTAHWPVFYHLMTAMPTTMKNAIPSPRRIPYMQVTSIPGHTTPKNSGATRPGVQFGKVHDGKECIGVLINYQSLCKPPTSFWIIMCGHELGIPKIIEKMIGKRFHQSLPGRQI